jgi:hypothetical protein
MMVPMRIVSDRVRRRRLVRATSRVVRPGTKAAAMLAWNDDTWWTKLSVADRVRLAFRLSVEQWRLNGWQEDWTRAGLSRSVARVRRPRRTVPRGRRLRARRARPAARYR